MLYNVVSELLMKVHRDEKQARASTAAIRVEKLASDASESSPPDSRPDLRIETDAAIYEDGKVMLKENPLKTTKEILCPRCKLPRLLYPTDGKGARKPDASVIYCKRYPYIDKPGHDIYGQTWVAPGPGRGKKKKDVEKARQAAAVAAGEESPGKSPAPGEQRPPNVLSYPSATCVKCKRCILVTRLNNHMGACIGNNGRNASRAAAAKISNGANGSQSHDPTPPSSQKGTPVPTSRPTSPKKREASVLEDDDGDGSETGNPKKKKLKQTKKVILKSKQGSPVSPLSGIKKEKVKPSSGLSVEQKVDDEKAEITQTEILPPKPKNLKAVSPTKKIRLGPPTSATKIAPPMSPPSVKHGREDAESESSGTLSSPPR